VTGVSIGVIAAALLFATGNVLPRPVHPPAMYDARAIPTGELGFARQRPLIDARDIRPGRTAKGAYGATMLANLTGKPMHVETRLVTAGQDLDRILLARVMLGSRVVAEGPLGQLGRWQRAGVLPVGGKQPLRMIVWMPNAKDLRYEGLAANSRLEMRAKAAGARP
jgi:hypothetical protein